VPSFVHVLVSFLSSALVHSLFALLRCHFWARTGNAVIYMCIYIYIYMCMRACMRVCVCAFKRRGRHARPFMSIFSRSWFGSLCRGEKDSEERMNIVCEQLTSRLCVYFHRPLCSVTFLWLLTCMVQHMRIISFRMCCQFFETLSNCCFFLLLSDL
jgi:hypothetical protein